MRPIRAYLRSKPKCFLPLKGLDNYTVMSESCIKSQSRIVSPYSKYSSKLFFFNTKIEEQYTGMCFNPRTTLALSYTRLKRKNAKRRN